MTTKTNDTTFANTYFETVRDIHFALANLSDFVDSLPAVNESGNVPNVNYAHLGTLSHIKSLLCEIAVACDGFDA